MRLHWLACTAIGCTGPAALRVEPATIDLDVELGQPAPSIGLRVFSDGAELTDRASFALAGAAIGTLTGPQLVSDGHTGGAATIEVTAGGATATVAVTATVRETRLVTGTPADAPSWFASGQDVAAAQPLEPADGAALPPDLGKLEVDFGAAAGDDVHEIAVTAPYLDLRVYASGSPHVELDADEWQAIASTARGDGVTLDARSTATGGGAPLHLSSSHLELADLDASALVFGGAVADATGAMTGRPQLYRYDMRHATVAPFVFEPADGTGCIGCHIAVSPDGARIAAAGMVGGGGAIVGMIIDTKTRAVMTVADTSPWNTGVYDPSGRLLTSLTLTGELTLRDGTTATPLATLALGEPAAGPAISPDGHSLAYAAMAAPEANNPAGTALRVRPWDAATATVGAPITVATDAGIIAPQFSSDGAWILYTRSTEATERGIIGSAVVRADGSAPPVVLSDGAGDQIPRWASPVASARAGGRDAEPIVWVAFASSRAIAASPNPVKSLWLAAFYPARGVLGVPFRLPGQSSTLFALHAPYALP